MTFLRRSRFDSRCLRCLSFHLLNSLLVFSGVQFTVKLFSELLLLAFGNGEFLIVSISEEQLLYSLIARQFNW